MSTQDSCQCGRAMLASHSARTRRFIKRGNMKRLVFKGRCDLLARCAIRYVCLAMCLMYRTFGALAQHNTTRCKQTMGFPYMFYSSSPPTLPTHQNLPVRLQRGPIIWFPVPRSAGHVYQHARKSCSEFLRLGVYGDNCFPLQVVRPPTRRVSIAAVQSRSVAKPGRPLPARCNVQRSRPAQHTGQRLWSPRRLLSHSARGCDRDELRANSRMRRAPDGRV